MPTATTAGTTGTTTEAGSPYPARWAAGTARAGFPPRRRRTGRPRAPAAVGTGRSSGPCGAGLPAVRLRRGRPACAAVADHGRTAGPPVHGRTCGPADRAAPITRFVITVNASLANMIVT